MYAFSKINTAGNLPQEWDYLADCIFQRKSFLHHAEQYNACQQRYYLYLQDGILLAGACVYTLPVELFTFSKLKGRMAMQVLGLPASVSAPGLFAQNNTAAERLMGFIQQQEFGLMLGLNFSPGLHYGKGVGMHMLPTVVVQNRFDTWPQYLKALRSPYRHRAKLIQKAIEGAEWHTSACDRFSEAHYALYRQIMQHTPSKLEVLSLNFFRNLPAPFMLTSCYVQGKLACWHTTCGDGDTLYFFFGGHDYALLQSYHVYFNNLFSILGQAIEGGYHCIDLGQTAEIAKMKAGGTMVHKEMFLYHRNPLARLLLRIARPLITYHLPTLQLHPFKTGAAQPEPENILV